jgi:hypothetical protein
MSDKEREQGQMIIGDVVGIAMVIIGFLGFKAITDSFSEKRGEKKLTWKEFLTRGL